MDLAPERVAEYYPVCLTGLNNTVVVPATFGAAETIGSALRISFGMGFWLSFFIHAIGIEIYVCQAVIFIR